MKMARERQVDVIVADERVQQALNRITQARSVLYPQLNGSASIVRKTVNLEAMGISIPGQSPLVGPFNSFDARLSVTQSIFDSAAMRRLSAMKAGREVSEAERKRAEQDAMALVASLYLDARRGQDQVTLAQSLLRLAEQRLAVAREGKSSGSGTELGVLQLESDLADRRQDLAAAKSRALESRLDVQAALGLPEDKVIVFSPGDSFRKAGIPSDDQIAAAVSGHPDVEVSERTVDLRKRETSVEKADYYPRLSASADYGASGSPARNAEGTYSFGGQLTLPIYRGGLRGGRIHEAQSRERESEATRDDMTRETEAKARSARENLKRMDSLLAAARTDQSEAQRRLTLAHDRLASGAGSSLELTEAEAVSAAARDRTQEADATYLLSQVQLARALGRLDDLVEEREH
jgi:outer membrane protein